MNFQNFHKVLTTGIAAAALFALGACSGKGIGNSQHQLDALSPSLGTPANLQNQMGTPERPPIAADFDPQDGIFISEELRETCKPFIDADKKEDAPQECQTQWEHLKNYQPTSTIQICNGPCYQGQGQVYTIDPAQGDQQPAAQQIVIPNRASDETTYQRIQPQSRPIPEGLLLYQDNY